MLTRLYNKDIQLCMLKLLDLQLSGRDLVTTENPDHNVIVLCKIRILYLSM